MIAEFGKKESDVSAILIQFGPNRFKKLPDMSVATFYHKWSDHLYIYIYIYVYNYNSANASAPPAA